MSGGAVAAVMLVNGVLPLDQDPVRTAHLRRTLDTYARPQGFDRLVRLVRDNRIVVFDMEENSGRTTHAEALAARLAGLSTTEDQPTGPALAGDDVSGTARYDVGAPSDPHTQYADWQLSETPVERTADAGEAAKTTFDVARLMFGGSAHFPVTRLPSDQSRVWLLEIPTDEEDFRVSESFGDCLPALDRLLTKQHSRLVVLTRPGQWRRIGGSSAEQWPSARALLTRVESASVARAQLIGRMPEINVRGWLEHRDIKPMIEQSNFDLAVELVEDILSAEQTSSNLLPADPTAAEATPLGHDAEALLARRIAMVVDSRGLWRKQLLAWHRRPERTAFERDFQVASAALTGLPVTHVYYGAAQLNNQLGSRGTVDADGQNAPGVIAMLDAIGGELTADDRIRFPRPGWADSILEYFWVDRPLARSAFLDWLAKTPTYRAGDALEFVSDDQRRAAARRITRFALSWAARHKREAPLTKLALAWRDSHLGLWQELVEIISAVASASSADPAEVGHETASLVTHQHYVHRLLLSWAKTAELAPVVLQVCTGPFADRHTSKALVRLKHAGRHANHDLRPVLEQVIFRLWQESSARSTLISEIVGWCDALQHRVAGSVAFARLAAITDATRVDLHHHSDVESTNGGAVAQGVALLRQTGDYIPDHSMLARCWRTHLAVATATANASLVPVWLDAAISDPTQHDAVLDVLRQAVRGTTAENRNTRDVIRGIVRTWSADDLNRVAFYHELTAALDIDIHQTMDTLLSNGAGQ
jgi:hypothetical protein